MTAETAASAHVGSTIPQCLFLTILPSTLVMAPTAMTVWIRTLPHNARAAGDHQNGSGTGIWTRAPTHSCAVGTGEIVVSVHAQIARTPTSPRVAKRKSPRRVITTGARTPSQKTCRTTNGTKVPTLRYVVGTGETVMSAFVPIIPMHAERRVTIAWAQPRTVILR